MPGRGALSTFRFGRPVLSVALALLLAATAATFSAHALTEPKKEPDQVEQADPGKAEVPPEEDQTGGTQTLPMPDSLIKKPGEDAPTDVTTPSDTPDKPVELVKHLDTLTEPVKKIRTALVQAAA